MKSKLAQSIVSALPSNACSPRLAAPLPGTSPADMAANGVRTVACGSSFTVALFEDGSVLQLGTADPQRDAVSEFMAAGAVPLRHRLPNLAGIDQVSLSLAYACACVRRPS